MDKVQENNFTQHVAPPSEAFKLRKHNFLSKEIYRRVNLFDKTAIKYES
jgi:hypothetical protein